MPIIVAVIGVIGAVAPAIYVNSLQTQPDPDVGLEVFSISYPTRPAENNKTSWFHITVTNERGNAPATNLSLILVTTPVYGETSEILSITNTFSTTDVILPQYDNATLKPGTNKTINQSPVVIQIPKLIHGAGSVVSLEIDVNNTSMPPYTNNSLGSLRVHAIYDQGSDFLYIGKHFRYLASNHEPSLNVTKEAAEITRQAEFTLSTLFTPGLTQYYIVFFTILGIVTYVYFRRRKGLHRFRARVINNVMDIRGELCDDLTNKDIFSEIWFEMPEKKRQDNHDIGDYLIIDDFYSKLKRRNLYLSRDIDKEDSDLSRTNTLSRLNEALLAAAENVLSKVDWNKYR